MDSNENWADAMKKILNKDAKTKSVVLEKGKKDHELQAKALTKKEKALDFEIVGSNDQEIKADVSNLPEVKVKNKVVKKKKWEEREQQRRDWINLGRKQPNLSDRAKERALRRIATRGVRILFEGVRERQKTIKSKLKQAGKSDRQQTKALKSVTNSSFMKMLKGKAKSNPVGTEIKQENSSSQPKWKVLRDDFMVGGKLKDWDKQDSDDEGDNKILGDASDSE